MGQEKNTDAGYGLEQLGEIWAIERERMNALIAQVRAAGPEALKLAAAAAGADALGATPKVSDTGIAEIGIQGPITKYPSIFTLLFRGTSTLQATAALKEAARDNAVKAILLRVDSPGGTVAGVGDLAEAVREADSEKPVYAFIQDLGASCAYWIASQARRVHANPTVAAGGIGVFTVIRDWSGMFEAEGIKTHVLHTGGVKGMGTTGAKVTGEHLEEAQRQVNEFGRFFFRDVARGRHMSIDEVRELADGRLHFGDKARVRGLLDVVGSLEQARRALVRGTMEKNSDVKAAEELLDEAQAKTDRLAGELKAERDKVKGLEDRVKQLEGSDPDVELKGLSPEARERITKAEEKVAQLEAESREKTFATKAEAFDALTIGADKLGPVLNAVEANVDGEIFAELERVLTAANAAVKESKLFEEKGSSASGGGDAYAQLKGIAGEILKKGEAKDEHEAFSKAVDRNPELRKRYQAERAA